MTEGQRFDAVMTRPLVVIPAWNEEEALPGVLDEVATHLANWETVVVSDGSTDGTVALCRARGVPVLDLPINLGVGGAMRAGYKYAERFGFSHVLQLDADGQHDPSEVGHLVDRMLESSADLVIGARFAGRGEYEANGPRRWAMRLLASILSRVSKTTLTDTTSGFKLAGPHAIRVFAANYPAEYLGDTIEALVIASRSGLVIRQTPVRMRDRAGGTPSHTPIKSAIFLSRAMVALAVSLTRPSEPEIPRDRGISSLGFSELGGNR